MIIRKSKIDIVNNKCFRMMRIIISSMKVYDFPLYYLILLGIVYIFKLIKGCILVIIY
jgi:hypothetical protein